ncbi:phosphoenolpyruvate--protein phosphotransferase [Roseisolibacter sp. H3M3-2]|uniref:phosphoenolpyruvate--protein phosphotransferase n=1 Tax=Roseisolibacter sp. H3M3-2 TaxID=3031323 RepID=UPI0023DC7F0E|nr:phosphoenolpyruvate--protein phosphotransferase [Roseisolibacter sp. H3M3-2]MDF1503677.1 phosphoenolpyruvate--protein phosphotransferase [Roseisolibacter sp. H3M3-2]
MLTLLAPLSGVVVPLDEVPDANFSGRMSGDGASLDPLSDRLLAPCDAEVRVVHRAAHAVILRAAGLEILLHVGVDTVRLNGEGFRALVKVGDRVRAGDPLLEFDVDLVARRARSLLTQVLVTNMERVASIEVAAPGVLSAGRDVLMRVAVAADPGAPAVPMEGEEVRSRPVPITASLGLHARPAGVLATLARRFRADLRLVRDGREADLRSTSDIMELEVEQHHVVTIVARGPDAAEAVDAVVETLTTTLAHDHGPPAAATAAAARAGGAPPRALTPPADGVFRGVSASSGVAVGNVFQFRHDDTVEVARAANPNAERRVLDAALADAGAQLRELQERLTREADADQAAIFEAHRTLLEDPKLLDRAYAEIRDGASAAWAWRESFRARAEAMAALKNPMLAARATDLRDAGRRVLHLLVKGPAPTPVVPVDSIVVAEDLTPSDATSLDRTRVRGFCTTMGSATSHVAILARGLGIPAVAGIDPRVLDLAPGTRVVLDGDTGVLKPAPSAEEEAEIRRRREAAERTRAEQLASAQQPATTTDGHRVEVAANIGDVADAERVLEVGGEGVGLLRSEFVFLERRSAPDEDEQTALYERAARALGKERLLVIRTLDVGGDKPLPYVPMDPEANPFLGERGVRLTLTRPELFRAQVRAILRASPAGRVAVMFPMIATLAEWRACRAIVERERESLGLPAIQTGIMVETAAAALLADQFAREADFLSIGTNDLTQYTLAMDRTNPRLAPQVDALHPSVLRLIEMTVRGAHAHGRWVGVCGALAGDPTAVPVLVGLGVDELSADVPLVPAVKARVRGLSRAQCEETARLALAAEDGAAVRRLVAERHG